MGKKTGLPYVVVRTQSAGVHAGELVARDNYVAELRNSRRLWYWSGAATLSELALRGVKHPEACKFAVPIPTIYLNDWIEIIPATAEARKSIEGVPLWTA